MDDQRDGHVAARASTRWSPRARRRPALLTGTSRTTSSGVPVPGHVRVPARPSLRADHRHVAYASPAAPWNPITCAPTTCRGRRHPGPGGRLRALHGDRGARRGARTPAAAGRAVRLRWSAGSRLRQRRGAVRGGDVQAAGVRRAVGRADQGPVRVARPAQPPGSGTACRSTRWAHRGAAENNVQRIVLEMLGVTLSRDARARAVQLPAWNEALGRPVRPTSSGRCGCSSAGLRERPAGVSTTCSRSAVVEAKVASIMDVCGPSGPGQAIGGAVARWSLAT